MTLFFLASTASTDGSDGTVDAVGVNGADGTVGTDGADDTDPGSTSRTGGAGGAGAGGAVTGDVGAGDISHDGKSMGSTGTDTTTDVTPRSPAGMVRNGDFFLDVFNGIEGI